MRNHIKLWYLLCLIPVLGFSCRHQPKVEMTSAQLERSAEAKLAEAATSVTHSLHRLAEIEEAATVRPYRVEPPNPQSYGMTTIGSIDWNGPIEPLVAKIAAATHYNLRVIGREPAIPVLVAIYKKDVLLADVLRDAGLQAGHQADIVIFPASKTIELRYANV